MDGPLGINRFRSVAILASLFCLTGAQEYAPPPAHAPDETTRKAIAEKTNTLGRIIEALRRQGVRDPYLAEVEIFHKAARWIVRLEEFYHKDAGAWTLEALDSGLLRALGSWHREKHRGCGKPAIPSCGLTVHG